MIVPEIVIRPSSASLVNQSALSGPNVIDSGKTFPPLPAGIGYSVIVPLGVILAIFLPSVSVNHRLPSGPKAIAWGAEPLVGIWNVVTVGGGAAHAGTGVGVAVGAGVGVAVGARVGVAVGAGVGVWVGASVGVAVGTGVAVTPGVGVAVGTGVAVGACDGTGVGVAVGAAVLVGTGVGVGVELALGVGLPFTGLAPGANGENPAPPLHAAREAVATMAMIRLIAFAPH